MIDDDPSSSKEDLSKPSSEASSPSKDPSTPSVDIPSSKGDPLDPLSGDFSTQKHDSSLDTHSVNSSISSSSLSDPSSTKDSPKDTASEQAQREAEIQQVMKGLVGKEYIRRMVAEDVVDARHRPPEEQNSSKKHLG